DRLLLPFTSCSVLFFFSSRGGHTRFSRDWSSDVCSSDLGAGLATPRTVVAPRSGDGFCGVPGGGRSHPGAGSAAGIPSAAGRHPDCGDRSGPHPPPGLWLSRLVPFLFPGGGGES